MTIRISLENDAYFTGGNVRQSAVFFSRFSVGAIAQASEPSEFREINLDVAEIRRGSVEWKIGLRHRVWFTTTFLAFNIQ